MSDKYECVIGLEVHCQLDTASKIFNADPNNFGDEPNQNVGPITLAHPGTLPKLNKQAVVNAIKMGLACGSAITKKTYFDRKNYFYPDLPKGYQVSQDKLPICIGGGVTITLKNKTERFVPFHHIHLEEDAGKSVHDGSETETLLDYNRAGTPLIEIVSNPDLHSGEEAAAYLTEIHRLVRFLGICDGNMEEGSMRADLNISVRLKGETTLGTKVEIKNMNSMRNLHRAADFEFARQIKALETGETLIQETRGYNADTNTTYSMRVKESMNDYRYFPEPDLAPIIISDKWLEEIRASLPVLPRQLIDQYVTLYGLSTADAALIVEDKSTVDYFTETLKHTTNGKTAANWINSTIKGHLNETGTAIAALSFKPEHLAAVIGLIDSNQISSTIASQSLFVEMLKNPSVSALEICQQNNWIQVSNTDTIQSLINEILAAYPDKVLEYQKGKKGLIGFFVGEAMKKSKALDPKQTQILMSKSLEKK